MLINVRLTKHVYSFKHRISKSITDDWISTSQHRRNKKIVNILQVSSQGGRIVLHTQRRACNNETGETEHSIHGSGG